VKEQNLVRHPRETLRFLLQFLKNPVRAARECPDWEWGPLISMQVVLSLLTALVLGLVSAKGMTIVLNFGLLPISTLLSTFVGAAFFYYTFLFLFRSQTSFKRHYTIVAISYIPFLFFKILSPLGAPIVLIGFAFMGLLLTVGLVESFAAPRKKILQLVGALYLLFFVFWVVNVIVESEKQVPFDKEVTSKSLDILHSEMTQ
jgi:hypothetical protein